MIKKPPASKGAKAQGLDEGTCRYIDSLNRKIESAEALQSTLKAREQEIERLKAENDFWQNEMMNYRINATHRARQIADQLAGYDTVRAESAERELAELKGKRD